MNAIIRALLLIVTSALACGAVAQTTSFTYQGQLKDGVSLAQGQHDFRFRLFDAANGGTQLGTTQCVDNIQVNDGVFTTLIDFGPQFTTTAQRFIEIQVRRDIGQTCADTTGYTTLTSRQPITPAPIAIQAASAFSLAAPDGSPAKAVFVDNDGKVGIGTMSPGFPLHIASTVAVMALQDTGPNSTQAGYVTYRNGTGTETAWVGFGSAGDPDFSIVNARSGGDIVLNPIFGNVGVGTATPAAKLEVRGDIRMGTTGQQFAARGEENLRILRGEVRRDGTILRGSGFTALKVDIGKYVVSFTTPFSSVPTVIVSGNRDGGSSVAIANVDLFTPATSSQVTIVCWTTFTDGYSDEPFNFIAVGPR